MSPGDQEDFLWKLGLPLHVIDYKVVDNWYSLSVVTLYIVKAPWQPSTQVRNPSHDVHDSHKELSCLHETLEAKWI